MLKSSLVFHLELWPPPPPPRPLDEELVKASNPEELEEDEVLESDPLLESESSLLLKSSSAISGMCQLFKSQVSPRIATPLATWGVQHSKKGEPLPRHSSTSSTSDSRIVPTT